MHRVLYNAASFDRPVTHIREVRGLGTKGAASSDTRADVDAFAVLCSREEGQYERGLAHPRMS
jgi:hypothetical protein